MQNRHPAIRIFRPLHPTPTRLIQLLLRRNPLPQRKRRIIRPALDPLRPTIPITRPILRLRPHPRARRSLQIRIFYPGRPAPRLDMTARPLDARALVRDLPSQDVQCESHPLAPRMAGQRRQIELAQRDQAAGARDADHLGDGLDGVRQVAEELRGVGAVEGVVGKGQVVDAAGAEGDVGGLGCAGVGDGGGEGGIV